jgi:hypothetical protein
LIESYNNGSRSIDDLFRELVALTRALSEEEQRHVRENMAEEELAIFDILKRPAPELSTDERTEVKKVAKELLTKSEYLLPEATNIAWAISPRFGAGRAFVAVQSTYLHRRLFALVSPSAIFLS